MRAPLLFAIGVGLLAATSWGNDRVERRSSMLGEELRYFPSGDLVRASSLGFHSLAADLCFVRAVQYYGQHRRTDREYPWTAHLFNVIGELDPKFVRPYVLGALILAEDNKDLPAALAYLERGQRENPNDWNLAFENGFLRMVHAKDYEAAAPWFLKAARLPEAPIYVNRFAAYCVMNAGDAGEAIELWREVRDTADDPALREAAERYIEKLEGEQHAG
jgi:tetratricopeptide (TPR) repeat protein